jgi:hypothetical protein
LRRKNCRGESVKWYGRPSKATKTNCANVIITPNSLESKAKSWDKTHVRFVTVMQLAAIRERVLTVLFPPRRKHSNNTLQISNSESRPTAAQSPTQIVSPPCLYTSHHPTLNIPGEWLCERWTASPPRVPRHPHPLSVASSTSHAASKTPAEISWPRRPFQPYAARGEKVVVTGLRGQPSGAKLRLGAQRKSWGRNSVAAADPDSPPLVPTNPLLQGAASLVIACSTFANCENKVSPSDFTNEFSSIS